MFGGEDEALVLVQAGEIARQARWGALVANFAEIARLTQQNTQIVRVADDHGDWQAAGCASSADWLAQAAGSDYRTAAKLARTSDALRQLPALDEAMSNGALSLDQVAAAVEFATPETDAELARVAVECARFSVYRGWWCQSGSRSPKWMRRTLIAVDQL